MSKLVHCHCTRCCRVYVNSVNDSMYDGSYDCFQTEVAVIRTVVIHKADVHTNLAKLTCLKPNSSNKLNIYQGVHITYFFETRLVPRVTQVQSL